MVYYVDRIELKNKSGVPVCFALYADTESFGVHILDLAENGCVEVMEALDSVLESQILECIPVQLDLSFFSFPGNFDMYRRKFTMYVYQVDGSIIRCKLPLVAYDLSKHHKELYQTFVEISKNRKWFLEQYEKD